MNGFLKGLSSVNLPFVEGLFVDFLRDPESVPEEWRGYFQALPEEEKIARAQPARQTSFQAVSLFSLMRPKGGSAPPSGKPSRDVRTVPRPSPEAYEERLRKDESRVADLQDRVDQFIRAYRVRGHMVAQFDPLGMPRPPQAELNPGYFGLTEDDMDRTFSTRTITGPEVLTLREIGDRLHNTYGRSIGVQFMHIDDPGERQWLQERMEGTENRINLDGEEQLRILQRLTNAVVFEEFLQRKFLGAKSFSLEGSESLIPLLAMAIERGGEQGLEEVVLAMAHRGRLNVLTNIMGKSPKAIFREFEDPDPELYLGRGDVKYHLGFSSDWVTQAGGKVHLSLSFNPSHLEFVNPVALGRMRAKQDRVGDGRRARGMVLLMHGDASFAGEGVVQETLNLSQLEGYRTGGTLHVIINNQIGFTTSPLEARSSTYATDVAKMIQSPIFHVNGEDPEAVAQVVHLAMDFRKAFQRDVVIDMYGYRRRGHNEGDEPSFTQPLLYQAIAKRKSVRESYLEYLLKLGGVTRETAERMAGEHRQFLEEELEKARSEAPILPVESQGRVWKGYRGGPECDTREVETGISRVRLSSLLEAQTRLPQGFHPHPKIAKWLEARLRMAGGEAPLDWSAAEALALASLAAEDVPIRLSGQDSGRGTFSHRHAILSDIQNGRTHIPLQHVSPKQAGVEIYNSPLSEVGVLGFEYGYSLDRPMALVIWEAQFGDFFNAAQVIVDQFIASAEDKWRRLSGLVMLLPHGFEGMGPEHSSARLERFLLLAASDNIQVVNLTTPAQYFHVLRRQMLRDWRKPLIIMSPKSLLRHPSAVSSLEDLSEKRFQRIIRDTLAGSKDHKRPVKRVLFCSGKIFYELEEKRRELAAVDVALHRMEQLYPFPNEEFQGILASYPEGTPVFWVQEEPENMGAWRYLRSKFGDKLLGRLPFFGITRAAAASPATGSASSHKLEQKRLISEAFGDA